MLCFICSASFLLPFPGFPMFRLDALRHGCVAFDALLWPLLHVGDGGDPATRLQRTKGFGTRQTRRDHEIIGRRNNVVKKKVCRTTMTSFDKRTLCMLHAHDHIKNRGAKASEGGPHSLHYTTATAPLRRGKRARWASAAPGRGTEPRTSPLHRAPNSAAAPAAMSKGRHYDLRFDVYTTWIMPTSKSRDHLDLPLWPSSALFSL